MQNNRLSPAGIITLAVLFALLAGAIVYAVHAWQAMDGVEMSTAGWVFLIMGVVVTVAAGFAIAILGALGSAIAGDKAMLVINALTNGLFATFAASAMYFAWKQMLGDDATPPPVSSGIAV